MNLPHPEPPDVGMDTDADPDADADADGEASSIRVLIADDHPMMSTALRTYVDSSVGMSCIGEVRDGRAAVELVGQLVPDVVVMDLHMPGTDGIDATAQIRRLVESVAVLAVTTFSTERYVIPALRAGAGGYIVKDAEPEQIITAIRQVHDGMAPFSPAVARELMLSVKDDPSQVESMLRRYPALPRIPDRELQGLKLLASGRSNAEIAAHMVVSEATVKAYMGRLMQRLGVRDRVQLIIRATELGLVEPSLH